MQRPNIVLILADDMGFGDFGRMNGGLNATPELDDLMASGLTLNQHYSASPVCAPARAALLTGRYAQRTGVIDTLEARGTDRLALRESTLADALGFAGYRTGLIGKWHCGAIRQEYGPNRRGFDEFVGFRGGWQDYWRWTLDRNSSRFPSDGRYLTDVISEESVNFICRNAGQPFFLHVAYNAPHFPFQAPSDLVDKHRQRGRTTVVATIYAMIDVMDRGVGLIRQALADSGVAENTLVLFTSDNGPDHGGIGDLSALRFNSGLAGHKQLVYEGGIRVPMIVNWPAGLQRTGATDQFVHLTDWFPTLLGMAGLQSPGELRLDGVDVSEALASGTPIDTGPRFWQWTRYAPMLISNAAMRDGKWKLVHPSIDGTLEASALDDEIDAQIKAHPSRFTEPIDAPLPERDHARAEASQLFDLESDPGETTDLAESHPQVLVSMETDLANWFETVERERLATSAALD